MTAEQGKGIELAHAAHMPAPQGGALPTGLEWQALERMAHTLAESDVIPYRLKRKPADVAVILLAAREYGIPPLMALSKLPVVNGAPAPMGELMVALVLRAGHSIRVTVEGDSGPVADMVAVCTTRRRGEDTDDVLRFTFAEAKAAGLVSVVDGKPRARDQKGNPTPWELYPVNMLRWRAVANACRLRFPDVLLGMSYLPEELGAVVDEDGAPIMGTVVDDRRQPPAGTLEERTAQEAADRLAGFTGPVEVLAQVTAHAEANGYLDAAVKYDDHLATLRQAIEAKRAELDAIVDVESTEEESTEAEDAPVEAPTAPQEAEEHVAVPEAHPSDETPQEAAYDVAREVLKCGDADVLVTYYRGAQAEDLLGLDVIGVVDDADLYTLEAPGDLTELPLGALIIAAGKYVRAHGIAVSDPAPAPRTAEQQIADASDPWADGSGMAGSTERG